MPLDGTTSIDDYWILISFEDYMLKIKYFYLGRFFIFLQDFDPLKKPLRNVSTNNIISGQDVKVLQYSLTIEK